MAALMFEDKKPFASSAVWACAVYSLVPFVGVVFVPFIFVFGMLGVLKGDRPQRGSAVWAMAAGVAISVGQLVLWWLLYAVPTWNAVV